jgi:hypothetical protein
MSDHLEALFGRGKRAKVAPRLATNVNTVAARRRRATGKRGECSTLQGERSNFEGERCNFEGERGKNSGAGVASAVSPATS